MPRTEDEKQNHELTGEMERHSFIIGLNGARVGLYIDNVPGGGGLEFDLSLDEALAIAAALAHAVELVQTRRRRVKEVAPNALKN